jgi:hypothetical protein
MATLILERDRKAAIIVDLMPFSNGFRYSRATWLLIPSPAGYALGVRVARRAGRPTVVFSGRNRMQRIRRWSF